MACDFYGLFFSAQGFFGGFDFCPHSFNHPRHLKSGATTHPPLVPQQYVASTHLCMYTWVKRDKWSKVPCLRKQHYEQGLNPRPPVRGVNHSAKHTSKSIHYLSCRLKKVRDSFPKHFGYQNCTAKNNLQENFELPFDPLATRIVSSPIQNHQLRDSGLNGNLNNHFHRI